MNRADLQKLTAMRLSDAKRLLKSRRNDAGAYYMAGYAIECAIKACIAKNLGQYPFPPYLKEQELRQKYYTHDLLALIESAELVVGLKQDRAANAQFDACWTTVTAWKEDARYNTAISRQKAEDMIMAVEDPTDGVLVWLKRRW